MVGPCASTCINQVFASRKVYLAPMFDFSFFLEYELCLHAWTLVQACCKGATTKISKLTAMPLVPVSLAFQHNSPPRQKKQGYERFTFLQHCKKQAKHISEPISLQKGWVAPSWPLRKNRDMVEKQVLTKWCLCWGTRSKHARKIHTQEKDKIEHPGKASGLSIPPYKMEWWWKEVVDAHDPSIMWFFSRPCVL